MLVSVICTVKNEATALPRLLDSLAAQTRAPDEIVIVDGGSTDATLDVLDSYARRLPLQVISQPDANISQGRNLAIRAAVGDIICSTDAGVRLDLCWVEELVKPFEMDGGRRTEDRGQNASVVGRPLSGIDVVSGFFVPDPGSVYETALAATTLPVLADIRPERFAPSSRSVAFRKSAWQAVNGYPEWLDYCEDLIFDFALCDAGYYFAFAPRAVAHFRPRHNLRAFFKQYYLYARGDGKANLFFRRHLIRYGTYLVVLPLLVALTMTVPFASIPLGIIAAFAMFFTPYRRLFPMICAFSFGDQLRAMAWVPIIRITGDIAKMIGYPVGVVWRKKSRSNSQ